MSYGKCPICNGEVIGRCRCMRSDSQCENGHNWFYCLAHEKPKLVLGHSDHSSDIHKCVCGDKN